MDNKLYVGNLPARVTEADLKSKFGQFGRVLSVAIRGDAATGRTRRFGFIEMASQGEAQMAINRLNMTQYDDSVISVNKARSDHPT